MNPDCQKEPNIIINNNNNSYLVQKKVSSDNDACACASSSVSLYSCENGQGRIQNTNNQYTGGDSYSEPACSCPEMEKIGKRMDKMDKVDPSTLSTGNPYQGMTREQLAEILLAAHNMPTNLEDAEAFKLAWQATRPGGGAP
jgi:hypothetical protein